MPSTDPPSEWKKLVARRAYELWEQRGRPLGSPDVDWHRAIRELREEAPWLEDSSAEPFSELRMEPNEDE